MRVSAHVVIRFVGEVQGVDENRVLCPEGKHCLILFQFFMITDSDLILFHMFETISLPNPHLTVLIVENIVENWLSGMKL